MVSLLSLQDHLCLSLILVSPALHQTVSLSEDSTYPSVGFPWTGSGSHSPVHVSIGLQVQCRALGAERGGRGREEWEGQTLPRQSSHWTRQQTEVSPGLSFLPTPNSGTGGPGDTRADVGEDFS